MSGHVNPGLAVTLIFYFLLLTKQKFFVCMFVLEKETVQPLLNVSSITHHFILFYFDHMLNSLDIFVIKVPAMRLRQREIGLFPEIFSHSGETDIQRAESLLSFDTLFLCFA